MNDSNGSRLKVGVDDQQRAWLMEQPGGAAGTIRELVDAARRGGVAPSIVRAVLSAALEQIQMDRPEVLRGVAPVDLEQNSPGVMRLVESICERLHGRAVLGSSAGVAQAYAEENLRLRRIIGSAAAASDNGGGSAGDAIQDMLQILDAGAGDSSGVVVDKPREGESDG